MVQKWLQCPDGPFTLAGYAGTGKTTLAKHFAAGVRGSVYFAAYTGKAAHVLSKAGCPNVSTIHRLIYSPAHKPATKLRELEEKLSSLRSRSPEPEAEIEKIQKAIKVEHENLSRPAFQLNCESVLNSAALLIVDEYSMIDQQMGKDIMSFDVPVLALGDPGQLPPIRGEGYFGKPDIVLSQIHRQAEGNPIIDLATRARKGQELIPGTYGSSRVVRYSDIPAEELRSLVLGTDQLLVGRNATRSSSNRRARELLGRTSPFPEAGDKLVCLRNDSMTGLLNGSLWTCRENATVVDDSQLLLAIESEDGACQTVQAHRAYFEGGVPAFYEMRDAQCFDYGYALTVHKSQGSQWGNVLLFDEWHKEDRSNWLYTAITRAAESVTIVQM